VSKGIESSPVLGGWLPPEKGDCRSALVDPYTSAVQEYRVISGRGTDLVWEFRGTPEEFEQFQRALTAAEAAIEDDAPEEVSPG